MSAWTSKVCVVLGGVALAFVGLSKILPSLVLDIEHRSDRSSANDLVARGWIPRCTSATATDISARFEVDTGELWGTFKFNGNAWA